MAQASQRGPTPKLNSLEIGRGIAALAVVAHHAGLASSAFTTHGHRTWLSEGWLGVDFFFVLSGFIIYYVHGADARTSQAAQRYFGRRLRRIYVPYLPITLALITAYLVWPGLSEGHRDWSLFTSLTLLPSGSPPALSVAWTLVFEMTFYIMFLTFYLTRHFWLLVCAWAISTLWFNSFGGGGADGVLLSTLFNPLILEFIAGMLMAALARRLPTEFWFVGLGIGIFACLAYFMIPDVHRVFFGLALAPIVLGLAQAEARFGFRAPKWALLLGSSSYAIYLVHNPLQSLVARAIRRFDSWEMTFIACIVAGVAAGVLYHLLYEKPVLTLISQGLRRAHSLQPD
ncbi:acyltransferase family protein [Thioclava nitratireducens]|uniref:acyltransferase family protein n=1 Tax=Thioclava nitratireducens TaxID=1915078 RepID=UPI00247FFBB6|nr:acyltransferase [Thioclava nitratireducens]WGT51491.1 acyltransferase [Thioclava nitratireducens]